MQKNRCIYCMEPLENQEMTCPKCKGDFWDYQWESHWMHPYTVLKERYLIGAVIKESAYSITYQAFDLLLLQRVVVKTCSVKENQQQFLEEAKHLFGKYDLPGMPAVTDVFEDNGTACFVMEFLAGESFKEFLKKQPRGQMGINEILSILEPVMETLSYWHSEGLVHGAVSVENLVFDENGTCRILGIGNGYEHVRRTAESDFDKIGMAPELFGGENLIGPWTDVYGLCSVIYECLTGKNLKECVKGLRKDKVKSISIFTDVEPKVERAVLQGLEHFIERRFFCIGTLADHLGGNGDKLNPYTGALQAVWGENWFRITTEQDVQEQFRTGIVLTKTQKKRLITGTAAIALAAVLAVGGGYGYEKLFPEKVLQRKIQEDQEYARKHPAEVLTKDSERHQGIKNYIEKNGKSEVYDNGVLYELKEEDIRNLDITSTRQERFLIRQETLRELIERRFDMEIDRKVESSPLTNVLVNNGELEVLEVTGYETTDYYFPKEDQNYNVQITSDLLDDMVIKARICCGLEEGVITLTEILPAMAPGVYLTEEEARELLINVRESDESYFGKHGRVDYDIRWDDELFDEELSEGNYVIDLQRYRIQDMNPVENREEQSYAGSYERDSEEYEEFLTFVKENAVSEKTDGDSTVYELTREAVLEWGQPCNFNLLSMTKSEFLQQYPHELAYERSAEVFEVEIGPYGVITTDFSLIDHYWVDEENGIKLILNYDLVTEYLKYVYIVDFNQRMDVLAEKSVEIAYILSKDVEDGMWESEYEIFLNSLERLTEDKEGDLRIGGYYMDCAYVLMKQEEEPALYTCFLKSGYGRALLEEEVDAPYCWPDYS